MPMTFGDRLAELLKTRHLDYRTFAKKSGISLDSVRRACQMTSCDQMRHSTFHKMAAGLDMTVEELHQHTVSETELITST